MSTNQGVSFTIKLQNDLTQGQVPLKLHHSKNLTDTTMKYHKGTVAGFHERCWSETPLRTNSIT